MPKHSLLQSLGSRLGTGTTISRLRRLGGHPEATLDSRRIAPPGRTVLTAVFAALLLIGGGSFAGEAPDESGQPEVREIFVPFEDLNVLLEDQPRRVMLSRSEYEELLKQAERAPESRAPHSAVLVSADYTVSVSQQRAQLTGRLVVDVLEEGVHEVPLEIGGVGLRSARLDGRAAAMGPAKDGRPSLLVEGKGRHELVLQMVAPLQTTAARQVLQFRLPRPPATRLRLTVPGDVEVTSGAEVASRVVDEAAEVTRFELLPQQAETTLVMTLNSRLRRLRQTVVARSVLVDEVTEAYEKLHATVSLAILHRAVDRFRFAVPEGFEITRVSSPLLARWDVEEENGRRVLRVQLQEQTTGTVRLNLSAIKTAAGSEASPFPRSWRFPRLQPLDVVGQVAVVGLLVEQRLQARSIVADAEQLTPIDTAVLRRALPETIFHAEPGTPPLRPVVAYYAPQGEFNLTAEFDKPPAELAVTTNLLLILGDAAQQVRGGFAVLPRQEKRFRLDFSVPPGWHVTGVTGADEKPLSFERYDLEDASAQIQVRLPRGIPPGEEYRVYFHATHTPPGWLGDWEQENREVKFPVFAVKGAARDQGAIAVEARDDMTVSPLNVPLTPLDEAEKQKYGLAGVATNLAFRYESPGYEATLSVARTQPRVTARTFSFLRVKPGALTAHYEVIYDVGQARTRSLELLLPANTTPETLSIRGLGGVKLKRYDAQVVQIAEQQMRRWSVQLDQARRGPIHLAVDFQQPVAEQDLKDFSLPIVVAAGPRLAYQSGMVAVEGSAELDVEVKTEARQVDVGELVDAEYQPGRRLLGAYGFVGDPVAVSVDVSRDSGYPLWAAIVQRAELSTHVSADGISQTQGRFLLRTKALYLEVKLPPDSTLWAASLDAAPLKPQRDRSSLLVSLPAGAAGGLRDLRIVYETPAGASGRGKLALSAPKLLLRAAAEGEAVEVPMNDLVWRLHLPSGYEVIRTGGTVVPERRQLEKPLPAAVQVAGALYWLSGGVNPLWGSGIQAAREAARRVAQETYDTRSARAVHSLVDESRSMTATAEDPVDVADLVDAVSGRVAPGGIAEMEEGMPAPPSDEPPTPDEAAVPSLEPAAKPPSSVKPAVKTPPPARKLPGVRSLEIDLDQAADDTGEVVTFRSLGVEPRLEVTIASRLRACMLGWGLALGVGLIGLAITNRPVGSKVRFVLIVALLATLVPLAYDSVDAVRVCNLVFYAAAALVPYYLLAGAVDWFVGLLRRRPSAAVGTAATTASMLLLAAMLPAAEAASPQSKTAPYVIQIVQPPRPVEVPEDAIILPYDLESDTGIEDADRLLVPYEKYVELWNRAHPEQKIETPRPPVDYALAGASYAATLEGDEYLLVTGELEVDVYSEGYVPISLGLGGGVLARAQLDGKPARLNLRRVGPANAAPNPPAPQPAAQRAQPAPNQAGAGQVPPGGSLVVLYVSGKGRHRLELVVRMRLTRRGGWQVAQGTLPSAPATALTLTVPRPQTELRLGGVTDRRSYETEQADQQIQTALGAGGAVSIQWRPKVAEGQVDRSLTARSMAVLDVQEDGLRLVWRLRLEFRRSQREEFRINVPADYLLEKVEGTNVRGWQRDQQQARTVDVTLLQPAKGQETFTLHLWRKGPVGQGDLAEFEVPVVSVPDAALQNGQLSIRRSPLLDLRTLERAGVSRIDSGNWATELAGGADNQQSPLGIRPYQAYRFAARGFSVSLAAGPLEPKLSATVHTLLKIAEYERILESRVTVHAQRRPLYLVEILVPEDLEVTRVSAPGEYQWVLTRQDDRQRLSVYLAAGQQGEVPILLQGTLGGRGEVAQLPLPGIEVLHVQRQPGDIAVQLDPAFDVKAGKLENCKAVLLKQVYGWLNPRQQRATRLALHYDRPDYRGMLLLSPRPADVACETITNVRVTDRAVEETILLDFTIRGAGIRELSFLLPEGMDDCRIQVPMLRQRKIERTAEGQLRVWIELQDEVMDQLRVLVENDRPLTAQSYSAPIPTVLPGRAAQMWRTGRQYVALETASRDEVVVKGQPAGLKVLSRQQKEWDRLKGILGDHITQAYLVLPGTQKPQLVFEIHARKLVKTAEARIGLAETVLVLDTNGAYRAAVTYRLDNTTEQFLQIELPPGAELWTARVAGEPVKPAGAPGAGSTGARLVRIPLVKTAPGDLDYAVVLIYGGTMPVGRGHTGPGSLGKAEFPLVHTRNINVELSQVRLFVPKTHRWFAFGGTMGLATVREEDDLAAGFVSYATKQVQRLRQTMRGSGKFAKVRAAHNLKQLGTAMQEFQSTRGDYAPNATLQAQLESNDLVLQQAQREIEQLDVAPEPLDTDNRFRLNARYEGQKASRSRNVVQDLGGNFSGVDQQAPSGERGEMVLFNGRWLYSNQLDNPALDPRQAVEQTGPAVVREENMPVGGKPGGTAVQFKGRKSGPGVQGRQPSAPEVAQGTAKSQLVEDYSRQMTESVDRRPGYGDQRDAALRYQQKLQQRTGGEQGYQIFGRATADAGDRLSVGMPSVVLDVPLAADGQTVAGVAFSPDGQTIAAGASDGVVLPTGLASLELQLPEHDDDFYQVYRFTTPRGEVEITAWAVSENLLTRLLRLAGVVAALVVLACFVRLARAGWFAWLGGPGGSTLLICAGLLGLLLGILPAAGLVVLVAGIVIKIRRAVTRSANRAAARSVGTARPITAEVVEG